MVNTYYILIGLLEWINIWIDRSMGIKGHFCSFSVVYIWVSLNPTMGILQEMRCLISPAVIVGGTEGDFQMEGYLRIIFMTTERKSRQD